MFENRALGAPLIFEIAGAKVQPWSIGFKEAKPMGAAFALSNIEKVFRSNGQIWNPGVLSRVKSEVLPNLRLDLFDNNLLTMLEEFFQPKPKDVLERAFVKIQGCFKEIHGDAANVEQLFNYLFRFVTAKIFQDRGDLKDGLILIILWRF